MITLRKNLMRKTIKNKKINLHFNRGFYIFFTNLVKLNYKFKYFSALLMSLLNFSQDILVFFPI